MALSSPPKRHTRFCGIDVAKNKHVGCVIDQDGAHLVRSQSFANTTQGYQQILDRLDQAGGSEQILVGMEATGHYWYGLHDFLVRHQYQVIVLNPIQTAQQAKKGIRKTQNDRIDAGHIAVLLRNGEHKPALIPTELGYTCRHLTRLYHTMVRQQARIKQLLWAQIHPIWPEYEDVFTHPFCRTGRTLLQTAPAPGDVLKLTESELEQLVRKTSRGKCGTQRAQKIRTAAQNTAGMSRGLEAARIGIRCLLDQLDALEPVRDALAAHIEARAQQLPAYLLTLPGATAISIVSLFGETDPMTAFTSPSQLVAFAGLDPIVADSGEMPREKPARRISKRGSPALRCTLWNMAMRACFQEGDLQNYYRRRRAAGIGHLSAVTAAALKLCHITWRIMTDKRDYLPHKKTTQS